MAKRLLLEIQPKAKRPFFRVPSMPVADHSKCHLTGANFVQDMSKVNEVMTELQSGLWDIVPAMNKKLTSKKRLF